jgi:5-formyltetrahydrofolate cyclo-ligase
MNLDEAKQELRERQGAWLREVSPALRAEAGDRVAARVLGCPEFERARRLILYAALPQELPTRSLFEEARKAGKRCLFPRCMPGDTLEFAEIDEWQELEKGHFGVLEPPARRSAAAVEETDLVMLPGLAFTMAGHRLGRGRGYYDRTFALEDEASPPLFGICFHGQIVPVIPTEPHDRRLDAVVSEQGLMRR